MRIEKMRYLLVAQSLKKYSELVEYCMPLGIAYINGAMRARGFDVDAMNMLFEEDPLKALQERIRANHIDVMMCGGLTSEFQLLRQIYSAAREANSKIIIVGGGGGFSSEPLLFSELTGVDYAVIGEGEITNCELAEALDRGEDVTEIKGLVYRTETGYRQTSPRPYIRDLDSIPFPSYEGLDIEQYLEHQNVDGWYNYYAYYSDNPRLMPMLMARSCPYMCSFCYHPIGRGYRARSLDNFFMELELWLEKYHINGVALLDECFSIDPERVIEFCQRISKYNIAWACQMRADTYTDDVLRAMKASGCIGACFGIESMSDIVLKNMNKQLDLKTIEHALELTYKYQIGCTGNLIFGSETETMNTIAQSLQWHYNHAKKYGNRPVRQFSYVQTYPGSYFYNNACKHGLIDSRADYIRNGNWNLNITSMTHEEYEMIDDIVRLCRRENYNRGEIIKIEYTSEKQAAFSFRCSFCHKVNTYRGMNRLRFKEGKIKRLGCRHCNMLGDYVLDTERFMYDTYIAIPWLLQIIEVNPVPDYFSQKGWKTTGIFGMNAFAKKVIGLLQNRLKMDVLYIYDHRLKPHIDYYGVPQHCGEDILPRVDVIINTDIAYRKDMDIIIETKTGQQAIDLEALLREWRNGCASVKNGLLNESPYSSR